MSVVQKIKNLLIKLWSIIKRIQNTPVCAELIFWSFPWSHFFPLELVFTQVGPFYSYNFASNIFYFLFKVIKIFCVMKQFVNIVFISSVMLLYDLNIPQFI